LSCVYETCIRTWYNITMLKPFKNPRTGIYYYRKTIPKSLRDVIGKTEILVSLKTTNIREAMPQFYEEALRADRLITTAREGDCIDTTLDFSNLSNYDFGDRPPEWEIEEEVRISVFPITSRNDLGIVFL